MPRFPKAPQPPRRRLSDVFYTPEQKQRLSRNRAGRGVIRYIDATGNFAYYDIRAERDDLTRAAGGTPPYRGRHRRGQRQ